MSGLYPKLCNNSIIVMSLLFEINAAKTFYNALHKPTTIVSLYKTQGYAWSSENWLKVQYLPDIVIPQVTTNRPNKLFLFSETSAFS